MNLIELNAVLYYADFLSMLQFGHPVTDTCKYFFIHHAPINACYLADTEPVYDPENQCFKQSLEEYTLIKNKFVDEGVESFINDVCSIKACGCVSGERMLQCIHQYSTKKQKQAAFEKYQEWKDNLTYKHIIKDEDGKSIVAKCSKEIAHVEQALGLRIESSILESSKFDDLDAEENS